MIKSKTRRHRHRRNKLSRRMKKRGGVKGKRGPISYTSSDEFKGIQDYCIRLFKSTFTLNPSGNPIFNMDAYRHFGFNGRWKNIHTNTGISDETMYDDMFIKKLNSVVGVSDPGWIYNYSSREWKLQAASTPAEIAEYYNSILWLSQQNRDHIFWVPENYEAIMKQFPIVS